MKPPQNSSTISRPCREYAVLAFLLIACLWAAPSKAQTYVTNILYQDMFSGSPTAPLSGRTPDTVDAYGTGNHTWVASGWLLDGSGDAIEDLDSGLYNALLPFVPVPGRVYTLSASLECVSDSWVALGFVGSGNTTAWFAGGSVNAVGWQLVSPGAGTAANKQQTFMGPSTAREVNANVSYSTPLGTYATVLDTTPTNPANWTFTFLINGTVAVPTTAFGGSGPVINYVGFGNGDVNDSDVVSNFTLTEVVAAQAPTITTQPQPTLAGTNYPGDYVVLSVAAAGYPGPYYQWQFNSINISGATNSSFTLPNLALTNAGSYRVLVTNNAGSVTSAAVAVVVETPVTNLLYEDTFSGTYAPLNGRVPDTKGAPNQWIAYPNWVAGDTNGIDEAAVNIGSSAFLPFVPVAGQVYILSATLEDQAGGGGWAALGYSGADVTNRNLNQGTTVGWILARPDGAAQPNQAFVGPGTVGGSETSDFSTGPATYTTILDTRPTSPAKWNFSFQVNGVTVLPPTPYGSSGPSITYVGMSGYASDSVTAQNFTLTELSVPIKPYIVTQPQPSILGTNFPGDAVTLTVLAGGYPAPTYQWQENSTNISGATNSSLVFANLALTNTGSYQVLVSNSLGSVTSAAVAVDVVIPVTNVVYSDTFSGTFGPLNGRVPDTAGAPTQWTASTGWDAGNNNGVNEAAAAGGGNGPNAYLPFVPVVGQVYVLTAVIDDLAGGVNWIALGYSSGAGLDGGWLINNGVSGWMLARDDGDAGANQVFIGPYVNGSVNLSSFSTGPSTNTTILDARAASPANWTFSFQVNGVTVLAPTPYGSTGPAITYVGFGGNGADSLTAQNFTLYDLSPVSQPRPITATVSGNQLTVSWSAGTLQEATSLTGPWTPVPGASAPSYTVTMSGPQMFFRVKQ